MVVLKEQQLLLRFFLPLFSRPLESPDRDRPRRSSSTPTLISRACFNSRRDYGYAEPAALVVDPESDWRTSVTRIRVVPLTIRSFRTWTLHFPRSDSPSRGVEREKEGEGRGERGGGGKSRRLSAFFGTWKEYYKRWPIGWIHHPYKEAKEDVLDVGDFYEFYYSQIILVEVLLRKIESWTFRINFFFLLVDETSRFDYLV